MIPKYNTLSFVWGVPGLIIQIAGVLFRDFSSTTLIKGQLVITNPFLYNLCQILSLAGTIIFLVGLAYYAKAKGRSPWWCLFAFLSLIGLIVLACLKDHAKNDDKVSLVNFPNK